MGSRQVFKMFICFLLLVSSIAWTSHSAFSESEFSTLEDQLEMYMKEHEAEIAGLAAIVLDQDAVIYKMKGYSNREEQIPVTENTVFEWGSVSKILIWISVLQLAESGKLDLETAVETYLPNDFRPKAKFEEPVTMRHLMHHTAGFDDSFTDLMIHRPAQKNSLREVLVSADVRQIFSPGEVVAYSNYGSALAAYIVEEISGLDYRDYVWKNIFEPLHMTKTAIDPEQDDNKWVKEQRRKVKGYSNELEVIKPNLYTIPLYPAGSVIGTAGDLQKLLHALAVEEGTSLFSDETTIDTLFEPTLYYPEIAIPRIANGLFYLPSKSGHVYGHSGNTKAFSSSFYVDRKEHTGVLVLTNSENESTFTAGIPELVFGDYTHSENDSSLEDSSRWKGIYEPARVPRHGFSKVYGLFVRSHTKQSGLHDVRTNGLSYSQLEPGIYHTENDFSMYSMDVYSVGPQSGKLLSNMYSDLLYIPYPKHLLEWTGIILGLLAVVFSLFCMALAVFRKVRSKKSMYSLLFVHHLLNLLFALNLFWIFNKTFSMASYSSLKPFLFCNLLYVVLVLVNCGVLLVKMRSRELRKYERAVWNLTVIFTFILCVNVFYWEFYL
ncbi:serine hydrolase domain-containing protein [Sporosarcina cascadiensis]|uniref:serine hydrolase domain-containing protein n=1 Tax=Sporosarcina cascadiensis TaxID=2660747 RepID=UPI001E4EDF0A|nr:serine hydrolase domain-containing protein [Sporosarcina cascadiensis]